MITASDYFCGAGGSTTGLKNAGVEVRHAANHWARAIETHQTNHPQTEHSLDDLQVAHPSWYPKTTIAWFSPECTNHSLSKGRKRKAAAQLDLNIPEANLVFSALCFTLQHSQPGSLNRVEFPALIAKTIRATSAVDSFAEGPMTRRFEKVKAAISQDV